MASELISALLQLVVFSLIPLLYFLIKKKTFRGFLDFIGFRRSTTRANLLALLVVMILAAPILILSYVNDEFHSIMTSPTSMIGKFKTMGFSASSFLLIVIDAGIKTSLSEEIFFRGFVAKRLIAITSFQIGNVLQAVIFGAIHTLLFMMITDNLLFLTVIFIFPCIGAYFKVYLNEKLANGSIIPGWIAHGLGNLVAYTAGAFLF